MVYANDVISLTPPSCAYLSSNNAPKVRNPSTTLPYDVSLSINTDMQYDLDKSLFKGLDDSVHGKEPALLHAYGKCQPCLPVTTQVGSNGISVTGNAQASRLTRSTSRMLQRVQADRQPMPVAVYEAAAPIARNVHNSLERPIKTAAVGSKTSVAAALPPSRPRTRSSKRALEQQLTPSSGRASKRSMQEMLQSDVKRARMPELFMACGCANCRLMNVPPSVYQLPPPVLHPNFGYSQPPAYPTRLQVRQMRQIPVSSSIYQLPETQGRLVNASSTMIPPELTNYSSSFCMPAEKASAREASVVTSSEQISQSHGLPGYQVALHQHAGSHHQQQHHQQHSQHHQSHHQSQQQSQHQSQLQSQHQSQLQSQHQSQLQSQHQSQHQLQHQSQHQSQHRQHQHQQQHGHVSSNSLAAMQRMTSQQPASMTNHNSSMMNGVVTSRRHLLSDASPQSIAGPSSSTSLSTTSRLPPNMIMSSHQQCHPQLVMPVMPSAQLMPGVNSGRVMAGVSSSHVVSGVSSSHVMPGMPSGHVIAGIPSGHHVLPGMPSAQMMPGMPSAQMIPGMPSAQMMPGMPSAQMMPGMSSSHVMPVATNCMPSGAGPALSGCVSHVYSNPHQSGGRLFLYPDSTTYVGGKLATPRSSHATPSANVSSFSFSSNSNCIPVY